MDLFKMFSNKPTPKDVAKDRLKLILIHDRGDLAPEVLENIKQEILEVISKYVEIDSDDIDITITKTGEMEGDSPALVANIPIKNVRGR
ncbi:MULTISPECIES: cell division topological specificity factor MinE [Clostridium]|uniref:Cell division topological specificity factor n=2 Tax=Clostridium TaxID=1485 RepID=A0A6V8SKG1_9CLOT|nr:MULTISPECIES: cell division topological specificity factor MinE [Clostridium]GFP77266.1 Cell division topological specificity factor [Clostridium fungisolvens]GKU23393.1 cell division topological specificity factor [Clostridium folliculivorans]GKU29510.1 cell division topological specificity factor [Clostridium folliculivorans]